MLLRVLSFFLVLVALIVGVADARAAASSSSRREAHQTSDDVRVAVAVDGSATVTQRVSYRIIAGRFKSLDFSGVDSRAELVADAIAVSDKGEESRAKVTAYPNRPGTVRVAFDDPKGLSRGTYSVDIKYRIDLVATKMLVNDGAMWRLTWTSPPSAEGHDGSRVIFELPPAPTEPRLASVAEVETTIATLHRQIDRDELELVRAHVPRGEIVTWSVRVDPKAFTRVSSPDLRPPSATPPIAPVPNRVPAVLLACGFTLLAGLLAMILHHKQAAHARLCADAGARARPLLPLPWGTSPFVFGLVTVGAFAVLLWSNPTIGALLVVVAMACAAHRPPAAKMGLRGPGTWRPTGDETVLALRTRLPLPGDAFDVSTYKGKFAALGILAVVAALAAVLATRVAGAMIALPLAATAIVPLFVTGTRASLPPAPADRVARFLRPTRDRLARLVDLAHVDVGFIARFRTRAATGSRPYDFDEVRLACMPKDPVPGLRGIELALAPLAPGARAVVPEIFVRFDDGSSAAAKVAQIASGVSVVIGRVPGEKVLCLPVRVPTSRFVAKLLARLTVDLEGRRLADREPVDVREGQGTRAARISRPCVFKGPDRRRPVVRPARCHSDARSLHVLSLVH
ncbi:MAG: DUF2207 domain-containing protein [Polyangiaceae bacterium]|nr:DUF2207 domain-containing protein [Polyangiaceae bacterium]